MATLVRNPTTTKPNATSFKGGSPSSRRGGRVQHRRYRHGSQRVLHVCRVGHFGSAGSQVVHPNSTFATSIFSLCLPKCFACTVPLRFKLATNPQASPLCHAAGHNDVLEENNDPPALPRLSLILLFCFGDLAGKPFVMRGKKAEFF